MSVCLNTVMTVLEYCHDCVLEYCATMTPVAGSLLPQQLCFPFTAAVLAFRATVLTLRAVGLSTRAARTRVLTFD
jgi:hypothetical protein